MNILILPIVLLIALLLEAGMFEEDEDTIVS
jgi:hypothetical protein